MSATLTSHNLTRNTGPVALNPLPASSRQFKNGQVKAVILSVAVFSASAESMWVSRSMPCSWPKKMANATWSWIRLRKPWEARLGIDMTPQQVSGCQKTHKQKQGY